MTCVIIQWVFNLRPILVIGKRHHLAFIKVEGDAFSLFAWTDSGRETCRAADAPADGPAPRLAGRRGFEGFIGPVCPPPAQAEITHPMGCRQAEGRASPQGERCPASAGDSGGDVLPWCLSFPPPPHLPGVRSSVFCRSLHLSAFPTLSSS